MYALLEVQNSEQDANFVWLQDSALGEAGNEGSAVLMNIKPYIEGGERSLIVRGQKKKKKDRRLMKVNAAWEILVIIMGESKVVAGEFRRYLSRSRIWCSVWWSPCKRLEGSQTWQQSTEEAQLETNSKLFLQTVPDASGSLAGSWVLEFMTLFAVSILFLGCCLEEENTARLNDCLS